MIRRARGIGALRSAALCVLAVALAPAARAETVTASAGAALYRQGMLPSGAPLRGKREAGAAVEGAAAACVNCHRRSGLGAVEGLTVIPPIIGKYLFRSHQTNAEDLELPHVPGYQQNRPPYTHETLASAIREGVTPDGRTMSYLMPRYPLDGAAMAEVVDYLKRLTSGPVPGVTDTTLHFATIVTPDADPVERDAMLDVLRHFFATQKDVIAAEARPMKASREIMYRVTRRWQLHVWELSGAPQTWEKQLHERIASEPVFAVISGIGRRTWEPVHRFCEHDAVPCLFPNVELPPDAEGDFYPVYFSRGVLLEAGLVLQRIAADRDRSGVRRIVQVFRRDDIGADGARALRARAFAAGLATVERQLPQDADAAALAAALRDVGPSDALALWLRAPDVAALPPSPPAAAALFASGMMSGLERAPLPRGWRDATRFAYPFDLPDNRRVRMNFPLGWFKVQQIPVVAEHVQTDTYLACVILSEALGHMLDSFVRDFLVERLEMMISRRLVNGYYPRLGLAPGQRFASKGGYLVRFADGDGPRLADDGEWTVP